MRSDYLGVVEIVSIHELLIDEFGGSHSVRDMGALEAAVFRAQTGYYEDAIGEAAALMESLLHNHPFLDGNKRTAFAAADVHLRLNGWYLQADSDEAFQFIMEGLQEGRFDQAQIEFWLRERCSRL